MARFALVYGRLLALAALVALVLAGCSAYSYKGTVLEPPSPAPDFVLADQNGEQFRLSEQRGNIVVLFFGFTNCPDVCPTALADAAAVRRQLGADAERVKVALITVDPERDTPERLGRYVQTFDPTFFGLSGTPAEIEAVSKAYGVSATRRELPESALKYTIDHSAFLYVIDQTGEWRLVFSPDAAVNDIASDIRNLVTTGGS
jgi:protein SCO1/2